MDILENNQRRLKELQSMYLCSPHLLFSKDNHDSICGLGILHFDCLKLHPALLHYISCEKQLRDLYNCVPSLRK